MLYRVFPFLAGTVARPLTVPRRLQGFGRHDNPDDYTALYLAREPISAVAERIAGFRGTVLSDGVFVRPDGSRLALATLDDAAIGKLVDLDDPNLLAAEHLRPSRIATGVRPTTQAIARGFFHAGGTGLSWWSTLEASWTNVTLFAERLSAEPRLVSVELLDVAHPVVREAADFLALDITAANRAAIGPRSGQP